MAIVWNFIFIIGIMATFVKVGSQNTSTLSPSEVVRTTMGNIMNSTSNADLTSYGPVSPLPEHRIPLYLGGLFSLGGRADESGHVAAVEMGLDHVNQRTDVLSGYDLRMVWNDTQCYSGRGNRMFIDQLLHKPQKLLGPPCSTDAPTVAEVAHYWNLITVSFGAASPVLSDRKRYPYFFRTVTSTNVFFHLIVRLMREFGWTRVASIRGSYVSTGVIQNFISIVKDANFTIAASETIIKDPGIPLANLERYDAKIIYVAMFPDLAKKLFCEAFKRDMARAGYVWILYGWYADRWWLEEDNGIECTKEEMNNAIAAATILTVNRVQLTNEDIMTVAGLSPQQLVSELRRRMEWPKYSNYTWIEDAPYSYDALWAVALMLNKTAQILQQKVFSNDEQRRLEEFAYDDDEMARIFFESLKATDFYGMSGHVAFKDGDRLGDTTLGQMQGNILRDVALYSIGDDSLKLTSQSLWKDGHVPIDHTAIVRVHDGIVWNTYLIVCGLTASCIVLAVSFLGFNIKYRTLRIVRMSSPYLNNIIIVGSILIYLSVIVGGLESDVVSPKTITIACQLRVWLLSTGFVLGFGSMFSKTWRVYRVAALKTPKRRVITDHHLFIMVFVLLCIDASFLILWQLLDPMHVLTIDLSEKRDPEIPNRRIVTYVELCTSNKLVYWLVASCAYKGLLLLFGTWLAWETRQVTIPALNDSKLIGICVYNTVVLCIVGVSVSFLIRNDSSALFIFTSCICLCCATLTLMVIFLPKVIAVFKYPDGLPPNSTVKFNSNVALSKDGSNISSEDVQKMRKKIAELERQLESRIKGSTVSTRTNVDAEVIDKTKALRGGTFSESHINLSLERKANDGMKSSDDHTLMCESNTV